MALTPAEYLAPLEREMAAFEQVLRTADLDAPVSACGDWRLRDLGVHLADVHRWAEVIVSTGEVCRTRFAHDPAVDLPDWYAGGASALTATLRKVDPFAPCWHFAALDRTKAFWFRRQFLETLVHRFDAQRAAGADPVIEPALAADGVDEVLVSFLPKARRWHEPPPLPASLLVRANDTGDSWLLRPAEGDGGSPVAERGGDTAQVTAEASAEDLLLVLWNRRAIDETGLRITGDRDVATAFLTASLTP